MLMNANALLSQTRKIPACIHFMKCGHQLSFTIKRNFADPWISLTDPLCRNPHMIAQINHGCFCRITDLLAFNIRGVVAQNAEVKHLFMQRIARIHLICGDILSVCVIMLNGHFVLCESSRFIRTDH